MRDAAAEKGAARQPEHSSLSDSDHPENRSHPRGDMCNATWHVAVNDDASVGSVTIVGRRRNTPVLADVAQVANYATRVHARALYVEHAWQW